MSDLFFFKDDALIHRAKVKPWKAMKTSRVVDEYSHQYSSITPEYMDDSELLALRKTIQMFDVECFSNFFMVAFRSLDNKKVTIFDMEPGQTMNLPKLKWYMENFCIVGYNSRCYDVPMIQLALKGATCKQLYDASCEIIYGDIRDYDFRKKHKLPEHRYDHIDLIEVAPLVGSLKLYAGRLHTKRMQDLPIDPASPLVPEDKPRIKEYCINDLDSTELLLMDLEPALTLRCQMSAEYDVDLRSKSDAQIAEAVISHELQKMQGRKCDRPNVTFESHQYKVPSFIQYRTPALQQMLEIVRNARFSLDGQGYMNMPPEIDALRLAVGGCVYKMGIGGLHSTEHTAAHKADDNTFLIDRDVASYYPSIILNQRLYPKHLGQAFLKVYQGIVTRRLDAKKVVKHCKKLIKELKSNPEHLDKDAAKKRYLQIVADKEAAEIVADSLKITINGSFGKFGSRWSVLYAPDLLIQVTITGQLALLMLIEMIEDLGIPVVSANTDGVLIMCPKSRHAELEARIAWWQAITFFETEETRYKAVYSRDVNNYLAVKEGGGDPKAKFLDERLGIKAKGCYGERGSAGNSVLSKNPEVLICNDAVMELIANGTPIEQTIRACKDIRRFVTIRKVTGGARKSEQYLGKVIRWYYSTEMKGEINRATKGDKIPNSDRARPLMELPNEFPMDVDYNRYIDTTVEMLHEIGFYTGSVKASRRCLGALFEDYEQEAYELNRQ